MPSAAKTGSGGLETREMTLNMGPQHPATHGVLRLVLELDGETVVGCTPHIGYLHRGMEKWGENRTYPQLIPITDRLDYLSAISNNIGYCLAVERLFGIEAPPRAQFIRTIACELARISSHLLWLATHALDIGAMTVFLYCFREREKILDLLERLCGARLTTTYPRIGGVRNDADPEWLEDLLVFTAEFPGKVEQYETLIDQNRIWLRRTKGIGVLSAEEAVERGVSGPALRGSGVAYDVRKAQPYLVYDQLAWEVPTGSRGDVYDRYRVRMEEFRQSNSILRQCVERMPEGAVLADAPAFTLPAKERVLGDMESLIRQFSLTIKGPTNVPVGEVYSAIEAPKGELGFYLVSDGTGQPYRFRIRAPSFVHIAALPGICRGHMVADVIANIGSMDIVLGECDR